MNPVEFALRHPITMMMVVVALIGGGGLALERMRVDIFPPFDVPQIYVIQNFNGMSPAQMEGLIVNQFELNFQYVDGIKNVESKSIQQIALIKLSFYPGTDMAQAMANVVGQANRAQAFMPPGVLPPQIMRMDAGSFPVGYLVLASKTESLGTIADLAQMRIRPLLQGSVPGTVGTAPFGSNVRSIVINVDPDRLRSYNLTPENVVTALTSGNMISPAGNLYVQDEMPLVPMNAMIMDVPDFGSIPVRLGRNVYLRDVATVSDATDLNFGYALVNGQRSVYIPVVKKNTASTLTVVEQINAAMKTFKDALPKSVDITYEFDESPTVRQAIHSVATEGFIGAALTGLMILLFLRDWRSMVVVVFNIPIALLGSLTALWLTGCTINIMTLGGLALSIGMLVDEATVSIENIHVQMMHTPSVARAVERGSNETAVPRLLAMLCILSVFIPAFIMAEPVRSLFLPLSLAVGFAMITSYLLSSTLVPVLSVWLLRHHGLHAEPNDDHALSGKKPQQDKCPEQGQLAVNGELTEEARQQPAPAGNNKPTADRGHGDPHSQAGEAGLFARVQSVFGRWVGWIVDHRTLTVPAYFIVCALVLGVIGMQLGTELFPRVDSGEFVLRFRTPPGTNYELTREAWVRCLQAIEAEVGEDNIMISMGFAGQQAPNYGMNNMLLFMRGPDDGQMRVQLREGSGVHLDQLRERLREMLPKRLIPWFADVLRKDGMSARQATDRAKRMTFSFEPGDVVSQVMSFGSPAPIETVVASNSLADARDYATRVKEQLNEISDLRDVQIQQTLDYPAVPITIHREKAGLSGVTVADVGRSVLVATSSSRMVVRNYWQDPKSGASYQVQVQVPTRRMDSTAQVETIPLEKVGDGLNLMLRDVASVGKGVVPGEYDRTAMQRYLSVTANVEGVDLGRAAKLVEGAIKRAGEPPRGVRVMTRGQVAPMGEMFKSLAIGLAVAVVVIMVLLTAYFQAWRSALISLGAVPGVLSGVALMLYFTRTTLNIESFMGTIMCIGVSVSNSVMLVTFTARDWQEGRSVVEAAKQGAIERLRPILMTACAMTVGMVPMALALEAGSQMQAPLGRAVVGGLLVSTFSTLLIVPAIFALLMGQRKYVSPSLHPDDPESSQFDSAGSQAAKSLESKNLARESTSTGNE
jgi:multidrug efflux pump subunit AcrB